jgi:hypothetical protein
VGGPSGSRHCATAPGKAPQNTSSGSPQKLLTQVTLGSVRQSDFLQVTQLVRGEAEPLETPGVSVSDLRMGPTPLIPAPMGNRN